MQLANLIVLVSALLPLKALLPVLDDLGVWEGVGADEDLLKEGAFAEATPLPSSTRATQSNGNGNTRSTTHSNTNNGNTNTPTLPSQATSNNGNTNTPTLPSQATSNNGNGNGNTRTISAFMPSTSMVATLTPLDYGRPATETVTDSAGNAFEVEYATETTTILSTVSGVVYATASITRFPTRTLTRARQPGPTSAGQPIDYPLVMPSPLTRIPRAMCRRFPYLCVNAGLSTQPPRFLDDNWDSRDDEF